MTNEERSPERLSGADNIPPIPPVVPKTGDVDVQVAAPIAFDASAMRIVELLLKQPTAVLARIRDGGGKHVVLVLAAIVVGAHLAYGLLVGSFSGGTQWYLAPAKILVGLVLCGVVCFPSLFIFSCLSGAELRIPQLATVLLAALALVGLLLIGFAPIALVFSTSTNSLYFMGILHLAFWGISMAFGRRIFSAGMLLLQAERRGYLRLWLVIFVITILQMMTALRPILGTSEHILPQGKQFFLQTWGEASRAGK